MRAFLVVLSCWAVVSGLIVQETLAQETPAQETPPAQEEPTGPAADDRASFSIQLTDRHGGGRLQGWAGDYQIQMGESVLATGGVEIKYRDLRLQCESLRVNISTNTMVAEGSVILDEGPRRLIGDVLEYNLEERSGTVQNATAFIENEYYFTGERITKVDRDTFTIDEGVFTSCPQEVPSWSIKMGKAEITMDNYARIKNARLRFKKVPVFYMPYMIWPTTTNRSSGLLVPQPGFSSRRGGELSLAYYKTLGRSADATLQVDVSSKSFFGFGTEVRYRPSENTKGFIDGFILNDPETKDLLAFVDANPMVPIGFDANNNPVNTDLLPDDLRWRLNWLHETENFWGGFRGVVNYNDYSDPTYAQDFDRNVTRQTNNFIYSQAYVSRNAGRQSLNILVDQRENLKIVRYELGDATRPLVDNDEPRRVGQITETRRQLPEVEYRLRSTRLGRAPIYLNLEGNVHYLQLESNRQGESTYGRADLFANFSIPLSSLPWLSVKLDLGGRYTHYTNSINPETKKFFADESEDAQLTEGEKEKELSRELAVAGLEIVGPSFSKIFEKTKTGGRFSKYKHIIEPRFEYSFRDLFDDKAPSVMDPMDPVDPDVLEEIEGEVPLFDEIDRLIPLDQATVSLTNRIMAKPRDAELGGAFEIMSFTFSQPFSQDDEILLQQGGVDPDTNEVVEGTKEGPLRFIFRYNPSQQTSLKTEARYNTLWKEFQSLSLSGGVKIGRHNLGGSLSTRWNVITGETRSDQLRVFGSLGITSKLSLDANVTFDLKGKDQANLNAQEVKNPLQQRYFLKYQGSCYSFQLELRESNFNDIQDRDFRFSFTLKNVGTFIDANGSL